MKIKKSSRILERKTYYASDSLNVKLNIKNKEYTGHLSESNATSLRIDLNEPMDIDNLNNLANIIISPSFGKRKVICINGLIIRITNNTKENGSVTHVVLMIVEKNNHLYGKRKKKRFHCSDIFPISAYAEHPFLYEVKLLFRVIEISPEGFTLATSKSNSTLFKGIELNLCVSIPTSKNHKIKGVIRNIKIHDSENYLRAGFEFITDNYEMKSDLGEYILLIHSDISPKELREINVHVQEMSRSCFFKFVSTPEEWKEVLKVRHLAYSSHHDSIKKINYKDFVDDFDPWSRQFFVQSSGKIIACGRVTFPELYPERSELVSKYGFEVPQNIWDGGFVEASKLGILPEFRKTDIYLNLVKFCFLIAAQVRCRYLVTVCMDQLLNDYKNIGAKEIGITKYIEEHDVKLNLIYFNVLDTVTGTSVIDSLRPYYESISDFLHID